MIVCCVVIAIKYYAIVVLLYIDCHCYCPIIYIHTSGMQHNIMSHHIHECEYYYYYLIYCNPITHSFLYQLYYNTG